MTEILTDLYASELNFEVSCFWDGGYDVKLGDMVNGFTMEDSADDLSEAIRSLVSFACYKYPKSEFAKKWRDDGQNT